MSTTRGLELDRDANQTGFPSSVLFDFVSDEYNEIEKRREVEGWSPKRNGATSIADKSVDLMPLANVNGSSLDGFSFKNLFHFLFAYFSGGCRFGVCVDASTEEDFERKW